MLYSGVAVTVSMPDSLARVFSDPLTAGADDQIHAVAPLV